MIEINAETLFGFLFGFSVAERHECEEFNILWGFTVCLGIVSITVCKHNIPGEEEKTA